MKKTLKSWMMLVIVLSIVSCTTDITDNPVVSTSLEQTLSETGLFTDIKENPDSTAMERKGNGELNYQSQYSMFITQPVNHGQPDKLGPNAKKVINPIGVHSPKINNPDYCPAETKQEVMDFITTYIY